MSTVISERDGGTSDWTSAFTGAICTASAECDCSISVASVRCLLLERRVKNEKGQTHRLRDGARRECAGNSRSRVVEDVDHRSEADGTWKGARRREWAHA